MKKIFLNCTIASLIIFILSCSSSPKNNVPENNSAWPQLAKDSFITQCRVTVKTIFDSSQAKTICNCVLEKMMHKHPDINEVKKMSPQEVTKESMTMAPECLFQAK